MSKLHTIGTISYYFGLMILVIGFAILATGLSTMLTQAMGQIKYATSGDFDALSTDEALSNDAGENIGPLEILFYPAGRVVDNFFSDLGIMQDNNVFQQAYYPKFRSFFAALLTSMVFIIAGILMRMFDDLVGFVGKFRKKALNLEKKSILYREKVRIRKKSR